MTFFISQCFVLCDSIVIIQFCLGYGVGLATRRLHVQVWAVPFLCNECGQIVHTRVTINEQYNFVLAKV